MSKWKIENGDPNIVVDYSEMKKNCEFIFDIGILSIFVLCYIKTKGKNEK